MENKYEFVRLCCIFNGLWFLEVSFKKLLLCDRWNEKKRVKGRLNIKLYMLPWYPK